MKYIPTAVTRTVSRQILVTQKHSPTILFGAGVIGVVATTVLACRATLKLDETLNNTMKQLVNLDEYDLQEQHEQKEKLYIYSRTGLEIVKLYAPAVVVGVVSIGCLTKSHSILTKRNAAVTAAYAALDKGFRDYRKRVVDEFGEDKDREFLHQSESRVLDTTKGKNKVATVVAPGGNSIYARFFDQMSSNWSKDSEYNLYFLQAQQNYHNDKLQARGHVFLNEVYEALGLPHTQAGSVCGWRAEGRGDGYIDFGVFEGKTQQARDFVNGREGAILIDFNVDGIIWDEI